MDSITTGRINRALPVCAIFIVLALIVTGFAYNRIENAIPQDHVILFFYNTNVLGGSATQWSNSLKTQYPGITYIEAQAYDKIMGVSANGTVHGWQFITTRISVNEADILFVDEEQYKNLLNIGLLQVLDAPLNIDESRLFASNGKTYGIDVSRMMLKGLKATNSVGANDCLLNADGNDKPVIACLLKNSTISAQSMFYKIIGTATPAEVKE